MNVCRSHRARQANKTITIDTANKIIAINSVCVGLSRKKKKEMPKTNNNSICPTARTGATAYSENAVNQQAVEIAPDKPTMLLSRQYIKVFFN